MTDTDPTSPDPMRPDPVRQDPPPPEATPAASVPPRLPDADGARTGAAKPASAPAASQSGAAKRADPARATAQPSARMGLAFALILLGFIALAGAGTWAWMHPHATPLPATGAAPDDSAALRALGSRISRLEQAPHAAAGAAPAEMAALAARLDALAAQEKALATQQNGGNAALASQLGEIETRLTALSQTMQQTAQQAAAAARAARLSEAAAALSLGAPLGAIAHAPAALSRYADTAPPTLAALRRSFPAAAAAALSASDPVPAGTPFLRGLWLRAQSLVTLRQGRNVVIGNPAAGAIATARAALRQGDLAAALAALDGLDGAAKTALTPWQDQAAALLAARRALAAMLAGTAS